MSKKIVSIRPGFEDEPKSVFCSNKERALDLGMLVGFLVMSVYIVYRIVRLFV